jgi:catechol 2,3-dioxygenase
MDEPVTAIDPRTSLGHIHLVTGDLARLLGFYRDVLGFKEARRDGDETVFLSADGFYPFAFALTAVPGAVRRSRTTGLYHAAILLPSRRDLARGFLRLRARGVLLDGAADHLVSEALYLRDPDGNGLELYADRPRAQWPRRNGEILMTTDPLDMESLLAEIRGEEAPGQGMPPAARIGHVHLRVSDLGRAEAFYHGVLGFDVVVRGYPGALFLSAGGYHHHVGVNTWAGQGLPPAPPGSAGLRSFTIRLPHRRELGRIVRQAEARGVRPEGAVDYGVYQAAYVRDDDGIGIALGVDGEGGRARPMPWREEPVSVEALLRTGGSRRKAGGGTGRAETTADPSQRSRR